MPSLKTRLRARSSTTSMYHLRCYFYIKTVTVVDREGCYLAGYFRKQKRDHQEKTAMIALSNQRKCLQECSPRLLERRWPALVWGIFLYLLTLRAVEIGSSTSSDLGYHASSKPIKQKTVRSGLSTTWSGARCTLRRHCLSGTQSAVGRASKYIYGHSIRMTGWMWVRFLPRVRTLTAVASAFSRGGL